MADADPRPVFERDAVRWAEFETSTRRLYFDFLPFLERDARKALGGRRP